MEIKNLNNRMISAYKTVSAAPKGKDTTAGAAGKAGGDNFDKIEFDFGRATQAAKIDMASALEAEANIARIQQLQAAYEGDNTPATAGQIAETITG
ncbi:MAG: hypothetical protein FWD48_05605 [Oscillospiraceae bacterium]|nr:hypothetical protein [Oscillospiraceae bacterium]